MAQEPVPSLLAGTLGLRPPLLMLWHLANYILAGILDLLLPWRRKARVVPGPAVPSAVVTGADTGIGRELSLFLAQKGWRVYSGAFTEQGLQELPALHPAIKAVRMDVTKPESLAEAARQVAEGVGAEGLQCLVNNAGIALLAPAETTDLQQYKQVFEVNVFGVLASTQAFLPLLRKGRHKGRIINIGSSAGHLALPFFGAYTGAKHALEGLSDCMRYELKDQGIDVVLIKPGPIQTSIWQDDSGRTLALAEALSPEMESLYLADLKQMMREGQRAQRAAVPVSHAVAAIYKAITAPTPAFRYHVGAFVLETFWLKRLLPDYVWEKAISQVLREQFNSGTDQLEIPLTSRFASSS